METVAVSSSCWSNSLQVGNNLVAGATLQLWDTTKTILLASGVSTDTTPAKASVTIGVPFYARVVPPQGCVIVPNAYFTADGWRGTASFTRVSDIDIGNCQMTGIPTYGPVALNIPQANLAFEDDFQTLNTTPNLGTTPDWQTRLWFGAPGERSDGSATVYLDPSVKLSDGSTINPFSNSKPGLLDMRCGLLPSGVTAPGYPIGKPYYGAVMSTLGSFRIDYGYFEIVAKAPAGGGAWPGFFVYDYNGYADGGKTSNNEIDFYEGSGGQQCDIFTTVHPYNGIGGNDEYNSTFADGTPLPDLSQAFHTFGADLTPKGLNIYLDNRLVTKTALSVPAYVGILWYLVLTHDVDKIPPAWYNNTPVASTYPKSWQITSVKIFKTASTKTIAGPAAKLLLP